MAVTVNSALPIFGEDGKLADDGIGLQLDILARQVVSFAKMKALDELSEAAGDAATSLD